jgi:primosomal protein N' (replication factor Y)
LRYFQGKNEVSCNFCEYKEPAPQFCPLCSNLKIHQKGFGTERLQLVLKEIFKDAIIERFDRDELSTPKKIDQRLTDFNQGKIDILIGTQMISKGHNFKNTNLVLVLGTDAQINFPDFRANEKVYQQLVQVSGRSGRFGQDSEVLIHTFDSQNRVYTYLNNEINEDFFSDELSIREACLLPPYTKLALIYFTSTFKDKVEVNSLNAKMIMEGLISKAFNSVNVFGPRPSIIEKKVNRYTWVLMLKSKDINGLHNLINSFSKNYSPHYSVTVKIDIDPYTID